jgi:hypothetical protein
MSKTIPIHVRKGEVIEALVDDEDYERLASFRWFFPIGTVVPARIGWVRGRRTSITLARAAMGLPHGDPRVVRRIDTEGYDYRRAQPRCRQRLPGRGVTPHALARGRDRRSGGLRRRRPRWTGHGSWSCSPSRRAPLGRRRPVRRASPTGPCAAGRNRKSSRTPWRSPPGRDAPSMRRSCGRPPRRTGGQPSPSTSRSTSTSRRAAGAMPTTSTAPSRQIPCWPGSLTSRQRSAAQVLTILRESLGSEEAVQEVVEANVRRLRLVQG